jgi:uncharacterized protein YjbJ (UPF0337 family)
LPRLFGDEKPTVSDRRLPKLVVLLAGKATELGEVVSEGSGRLMLVALRNKHRRAELTANNSKQEAQKMDKDRMAGSVKQARGSVKEAVGKATGDAKLKAGGKTDQAAGKVQNAVGGVKDALRGK